MKVIGMRYLNTFPVWQFQLRNPGDCSQIKGQCAQMSPWASCVSPQSTKAFSKAWRQEAPEHLHASSAYAREAGRIMGPFVPLGGKCQKTLKWEKNCLFVLQMVITVRKFIHPLGTHLTSSKRGFTRVTSYLPTVILPKSFLYWKKGEVGLPTLTDALSLLKIP